jgi:hypothetical protein
MLGAIAGDVIEVRDFPTQKQPVTSGSFGSSPGIDRIGHQGQKRESLRDARLLRRLVRRLDHSRRVDERQEATRHPMPPDFRLRFPWPFS